MPTALPDDIATAFARRVAERDVVRPPAPPDLTPAGVAARLTGWLLAEHAVRDPRSRPDLVQMLLCLLAQPEASTATLGAAASLGPRMVARHLLRLEKLGLTEWFYRGRTRYHRLTRAAEDALVPVVTGALPPPPAARPPDA